MLTPSRPAAFSTALWVTWSRRCCGKKLARGFSAGRVQSVAVRLVVEREREIKAFVPVEFWDVNASDHNARRRKRALQVPHRADKPFRPVNPDGDAAAVGCLKKGATTCLTAKINHPPATLAHRLLPPRCSRRRVLVLASA
ncbi:DNA topoisomerase [Escherichia coli]